MGVIETPMGSASSLEDTSASTSVVGKRWRLSQPQPPILSTIETVKQNRNPNHIPSPPGPPIPKCNNKPPAAVVTSIAVSEDIAFIDDDFNGAAGLGLDYANATVV